jgi:hypothetical protein
MNKNLNLNPKVCGIEYSPVSDVEAVKIVNGVCSVIFKPGKGWLDFYSTPGSIEFEFPQDNIAGNTVYKQKVSLFFPGLDDANVKDLFNTDASLYVIKVALNSMDEYIVGGCDNPAQYSESFGTTKGGRSIFFWCDAPNRPFPYKN